MAYTLKKNQPDFDVVDGPFAGKKYRHDKTYEEVPPTEKGKFEAVKVKAVAKSATQTADKPGKASEGVGTKSPPTGNGEKKKNGLAQRRNGAKKN